MALGISTMAAKAQFITGHLAPELNQEIGDSVRDDLIVQCADKALVGKPKTWIQVAKTGVYKGHPAGEFEFGLKQYKEMADNFASQQSKPPLDFEHASEAIDGGVYQHGAPASGFIIELRYDEFRMEALVEWNQNSEGCQYVRGGEYRYISPAVQFAARDRVTGKKIGAMLTSVALTNRPFLDGMDRVTAKQAEAAIAMAKKNDAAAVAATDDVAPVAASNVYKMCKMCGTVNTKDATKCVKCDGDLGDDEGGDEQAGMMSARNVAMRRVFVDDAVKKSLACSDKRALIKLRDISLSDICQEVCEHVYDALGWNARVVEIFDDYAIVNHKDRLFKIGFKVVDGGDVELDATATQVERDYVPMEGGAEMKLLLTALELNESANETAAVAAVTALKASAATAAVGAAAQKALLTAKSAMGLPATATDEDVIAKVVELKAAESQITTLRTDLDAAKAEITKRDDIALNAKVNVVIKCGETYGFKFSDTPESREGLLTMLKHAPKAFDANFKAIFDGVAAGDRPTDFTQVAPDPTSIRETTLGGEGGKEATVDQKINAYIAKMSAKNQTVSRSQALFAVMNGSAARA
jgi:hypothetical protein